MLRVMKMRATRAAHYDAAVLCYVGALCNARTQQPRRTHPRPTVVEAH